MQLVKQRYASFSYFLILLISKSHIMKKTYIIPLTQVETAQAEMMMAVSITSINGDAGIELGDDAFAGPGLKAEVDLVVQAHHAHRIGAGPAVAEHVVVEKGA